MGIDATGFVLALLAVGLSAIAVKTSYWLLKPLAGFVWGLLCFYIIQNPIDADASSAIQTMVIIVTGGIGAAFILMPFWTTRTNNGVETGRLRLPFMDTDEEIEAESQRRYLPTRQERTSAYQERVDAALRGETRRR